jgi:CubicO group peptidase (beta-lactamase class C family)
MTANMSANPYLDRPHGMDAEPTSQDCPVDGHVAAGYEPVREAFLANFNAGVECGASVCATVNGKVVVDLWGGHVNVARANPWRRDTIVNMMSVAKAAVAVCALQLVEKGEIDLDAPIATYWPEFAANGKQAIPVRWLLDHRAGLPVLDPNLARGSIYDWRAVTRALAAQAPAWEPGKKAGYHILTMGFLVGELIRRVTGLMPGDYFRKFIAGPLNLDYHIGLPTESLGRCATFLPAVEGTIFDVERSAPESYLARAWRELPRDEDFNSLAWRTAQIPGANGHGNARAVARLFACLTLGGTIDGVRILKPETVTLLSAEQHNLTEIVMDRSYHQALGVLRNSPPIVWMGPNPNSFGHHGVGGAIGFADPDERLSFSYAMNQMHARIDNGPRAGSLIRALYQCIAGGASVEATPR